MVIHLNLKVIDYGVSLESKKIILSRDVTFNEHAMLKSPGLESSISSNTGDKDGEKVELETSSQSPIVDVGSSLGSQSINQVHDDDYVPITTDSRQLQQPDYNLARDRPRTRQKRYARYPEEE